MSSNYYQKNKEKLQKEKAKGTKIFCKEEKHKKCQYACELYRNLYEEEKEKKRQYGCEQYRNLLEDEDRIFFLECKK